MGKRALAFALALLIAAGAMSLSSCSGESAAIAEKTTVDAVFSGEYKSLPDGYRYAGSSIDVKDGRVSVLAYRVIDEETWTQEYALISFDMTGGDQKIEPLTTPEGAYLSSAVAMADGGRCLLLNSYDKETNTSSYELIRTAADGTELYSVTVTKDMFPKSSEADGFGMMDWFSVRNILSDAENRVYVCSDTAFIVLDDSGSVLFGVAVPSFSMSMFSGSDGAVYASYYDQNTSGAVLKKVDVAAQDLGEQIATPSSSGFSSNNGYYFADGYDVYSKDDTGIWGYKAAEDKKTLVLSWINSDVFFNNVRALSVIDADTVVFVGTNPLTDEYELAFFRRVPPDQVTPKYTINLAMINNGDIYSLMKGIVDFNRKNSEYRVVVNDYSQYNTAEDYNLGATTLNADIAAGRVPDILICGYGIPVESYEEKGVFADLYEFMDREGAALTRDDLLDAAKGPFERDGHLYRFVTSLTLMTMTGKTANVGGKAGWSVAEFIEYAKSLPEGVSLLNGMTRSSMLQTITTAGISEFVDKETNTCSFDSQDFIDLLNYCATLPETYDWNADYNNNDYYLKYRADEVMLNSEYISSFDDYLNGSFAFGFEPATRVGYPGDALGNGTVLQANTAYAIGAKSAVKDGAWDFITYLATDVAEADLDMRGGRGIPTVKSLFEKSAEFAKQQYYYFTFSGGWMSGNQPITDDQKREDGLEGKIDDALVAEVKALIDGAKLVYSQDDKLNEIIWNETESFFAGEKTAEETAKVIQSSAQIYLTEQS